MSPRLRRAGSPWRLLVHEPGPAGASHHVTNRPTYGGNALPNTDRRRTHVLEATEFDELAVGRWLHVEQMEAGRWWLNIGSITVWIEADRDGRPRAVAVIGPAGQESTAPACTYRLDWETAAPSDTDQLWSR